MEEILASIRRIISEDDAPAEEASAEVEAEPEPEPEPEPELKSEPVKAAAPAPVEFDLDDDVLELTERAPEPIESLGDLDLYPPADARPKVAPAPAPAPAPVRAYEPVQDGESLVSAHAAASSASAFGALAQRIAMPREGRTLEDVVREMMNPLLKAWLDEHLAGIVQAKVEEEVERIARRHVG